MPVPKKRTSHSKRNMRRSHHALKPLFTIVCSNCGAMTMRHRVCNSCGYYKGKQIISAKKLGIVPDVSQAGSSAE